MPADYDYKHISLRRLKALELARSRFFNLQQDFAKSGILDAAILERMIVIKKLLNHASNGGVDEFKDIQWLDELLGPDAEEIR